MPPTKYQRKIEVARMVGDVPVKLSLQERASPGWPQPWWVLSWRTTYSAHGSNRRFYCTKDGYWSIPAKLALDMLQEMKDKGGFSDQYLDVRRRPNFETILSSNLPSPSRGEYLLEITGADESWDGVSFFVITKDPDDKWKKVMLVDGDGAATFRSITRDQAYKPRKCIRPGATWWLDNSMMDANIQQMKTFHAYLKLHLD